MDSLRLLSGNGGVMFNDYCLRPEFNVMQCDIRLMEETEPLLPNTKCILLLGESAMHKYLPETLLNTLGEMRGSLMYYKGIPCIASFNPQEAVDPKAYEFIHNKNSKDYIPDDSLSGSDEDEDDGDPKRHGKTKRANYCFWLKRDVWKCKTLLKGDTLGIQSRLEPKYKCWPSAQEVIDRLLTTKNQFLYFDIETDYEEQNLQCFAFSFDGNTIYSVPILDFNYKWACASVHQILRALAIAIRDNILVAHNGATFDFFVLAHKYHIPIGRRVYDTMIAQHRCFPDIEKSLGHCISYWTWEKFHKDEDSLGYRTHEQMMARLKYCGKDVYTMYLIHQAITAYAKTIPGLESSIDAAMKCIRPYLIATLQGIKINEQKVNEMITENDRLMIQYNRMIELLIGEKGLEEIRGGKKLGMFASSSKQCARYFHDALGYPVMGRSKDTGEPSLGKLQLYKLALKFENPVLTLINIFRSTKKETSRLRFLPWIKIDETTPVLLDRKEYTDTKDTKMSAETAVQAY